VILHGTVPSMRAKEGYSCDNALMASSRAFYSAVVYWAPLIMQDRLTKGSSTPVLSAGLEGEAVLSR